MNNASRTLPTSQNIYLADVAPKVAVDRLAQLASVPSSIIEGTMPTLKDGVRYALYDRGYVEQIGTPRRYENVYGISGVASRGLPVTKNGSYGFRASVTGYNQENKERGLRVEYAHSLNGDLLDGTVPTGINRGLEAARSTEQVRPKDIAHKVAKAALKVLLKQRKLVQVPINPDDLAEIERFLSSHVRFHHDATTGKKMEYQPALEDSAKQELIRMLLLMRGKMLIAPLVRAMHHDGMHHDAFAMNS